MPRNDAAVLLDSFCRQRLGRRCRAFARTGDSVKGIASLPPSMRPPGPRVPKLRRCNVRRGFLVSPFSRLSQTRRNDGGVGVLVDGRPRQRAVRVIGPSHLAVQPLNLSLSIVQSCCAPHAARTLGRARPKRVRAGSPASREGRPRRASDSNKSITFRREGAGMILLIGRPLWPPPS